MWGAELEGPASPVHIRLMLEAERKERAEGMAQLLEKLEDKDSAASKLEEQLESQRIQILKLWEAQGRNTEILRNLIEDAVGKAQKTTEERLVQELQEAVALVKGMPKLTIPSIDKQDIARTAAAAAAAIRHMSTLPGKQCAPSGDLKEQYSQVSAMIHKAVLECSAGPAAVATMGQGQSHLDSMVKSLSDRLNRLELNMRGHLGTARGMALELDPDVGPCKQPSTRQGGQLLHPPVDSRPQLEEQTPNGSHMPGLVGMSPNGNWSPAAMVHTAGSADGNSSPVYTNRASPDASCAERSRPPPRSKSAYLVRPDVAVGGYASIGHPGSAPSTAARTVPSGRPAVAKTTSTFPLGVPARGSLGARRPQQHCSPRMLAMSTREVAAVQAQPSGSVTAVLNSLIKSTSGNNISSESLSMRSPGGGARLVTSSESVSPTRRTEVH